MLKKCVLMQQHFQQFVRQQRIKEEKYLGISKAKVDCVSPFSHKDSVEHSSVWFMNFRQDNWPCLI